MFTLLRVNGHDMNQSSTEINFHLLKLLLPQKGAVKYIAPGYRFDRPCCPAQRPGNFSFVA
jgi:hypothetical protein